MFEKAIRLSMSDSFIELSFAAATGIKAKLL